MRFQPLLGLGGLCALVLSAASSGCEMPRPEDAWPPRTQHESPAVAADGVDGGASSEGLPSDAARPIVPEVDAGPRPPDPDGTLAGRLQGDYFMRIQSTATDNDFQLGGNITTTASTYAIVAVRLEGDQLTATEQWCYMDFDVRPQSGSISTTVPASVPQTTPPVKRVITLEEASSAFHTDEAPIAMGFTDDGAAIPTSSSDSRVHDQDGDGRPGVPLRTVISTGPTSADCTFHIVRRINDTYAGSIVGDALADGTVTDHGGGQFALDVTTASSGFSSCDVDDANDRDPVAPTSNNVRFVKVDLLSDFACPAQSEMTSAF